MIVNFYLIVNKNGAVRTVKTSPSLAFNEIAIQLSLNLPAQLFMKPKLTAEITIPPEAAAPEILPVEVVDNVRDAIQQATGLAVQLEVVNHAGE